MGVLSDLQPQKVFYYFEEITKIPHGSGNVTQISDYLYNFAKERGIPVIQDEMKNIIMIAEATEGYEKEPAIILQGHMDMVAVKKPGCLMDLKTEGLRVAVEGDKIYAEETSLGGDDGIAVAYALAILDDPAIAHPRLEVVITVDEEVGMDGARFIDISMLQGKRLLNLDSEEEGILLASCAGGARIDCILKPTKSMQEGLRLNLKVGGLIGGHSGSEIHLERGNANVLMARVFHRLAGEQGIALVSCEGGLADNAIPRECQAELIVDEKRSSRIEELLDIVEKELKAELATKDPGVYIEYSFGEKINKPSIAGKEFATVADFLFSLPNGVQAMSADVAGLVETSLNLGILTIEEDVIAQFAARSSVESSKEALLQKVESITRLAGGSCRITGKYPGWAFRKNSPFRDKLVRVYKEMYGTEPKVEAIHAGLECGLLAGKIQDLDCISLGPEMSGIHTTEETLSISSTKRVWEYLLKVLETR